MISQDDIANVMGQRLVTLTPKPLVVWEGKDFPSGGPYPFYYAELVPTRSKDGTLKGGGEQQFGFFMVHVFTQSNQFASVGRKLGEAVKALYPYASRDAVTGGSVTIYRAPEVLQGYEDGPHRRTPVRIPYSAS